MTENITILPKRINNFWWLTLSIGIIYTVVGVMMIKNPLTSFYTLCVIAGIPLIISGIYEIYLAISSRKNNVDGLLVFSGLIDLGLGLVLVSNPKIILVIVTLLISLLLIFQGIILIRKAVQLKSANPKGWKWVLGIGLVLLLISGILIIKPEIAAKALSIWLGVSFIIFGVYRIFLFFRVKNGVRKI